MKAHFFFRRFVREKTSSVDNKPRPLPSKTSALAFWSLGLGICIAPALLIARIFYNRIFGWTWRDPFINSVMMVNNAVEYVENLGTLFVKYSYGGFRILFGVGVIISIAGIVCGLMARSRIKRSTGALDGNGCALFGIAICFINILFAMLLVLQIPADMQQACIGALKFLDGNKKEWAREEHKSATDTPTMDDLRPHWSTRPYLHEDDPVCPSGGTYTLGKVGEKPTCSYPGHVLP